MNGYKTLRFSVGNTSSDRYIMAADLEVCWLGLFAEPHTYVAAYDVVLHSGTGTLGAATTAAQDCAQIQIPSFDGNDGVAVKVTVRATNAQGLAASVSLAGFVMDGTPPQAPGWFVYGTADLPVTTQRSRTSFHAEWGPFAEDVSGPVATRVCLGTAPGGGACDVADAGVGPATRVAWTVAPVNASRVYVALRACNRAGLCRSWAPARALLVDDQPPNVTVAVPQAVVGFGAAADPPRRFPSDTRWLPVAELRLELEAWDAASGLAVCRWALGGTPGNDKYRPFAELPVGEHSLVVQASVPVTRLPQGALLYATVLCRDVAGSHALVSVPVVPLWQPPGTAEAQVHVSPSAVAATGAVKVTWWGFDVVAADLVGYSVAAGTAPGLDDVVSWESVGNRTEGILEGFQNRQGQIWVSARARYPSLLEASASTPIVVDSTPPVPGVVERLSTGPALPHCMGNDSAIHVQWHGFVDAESGIAAYVVGLWPANGSANCSASDAEEAAVLRAETGLRAYHTFPQATYVPGDYVLAVRAADGVGNQAAACQHVRVDGSAPRVGDVTVVGGVDWAPGVVGSGTSVVVQWGAATDDECEVVAYLVGIGRHPDSFSVYPLSSVGRATFTDLGNLTMQHGKRYAVTVQAVNAAGLDARAHTTFLVDLTHPGIGAVFLRSGGRCRAAAAHPTYVASNRSVTVCTEGLRDPESDTVLEVAAFDLGEGLPPVQLTPWINVSRLDVAEVWRGPVRWGRALGHRIRSHPAPPRNNGFSARARTPRTSGFYRVRVAP